MKPVCAAALFAASGAATPSIAPRPKRAGSRAIFFSSMYAANDESAGPVPGRMPKSDPTAVPRTVGQAEALTSSALGISRGTLSVNTTRGSVDSSVITISATAKSPTAITVKPMPSMSSGTPKAKRTWPELTSAPTIPSKRPSATIARPFTASPCASTAEPTSPISISAQYSHGPNFSAHSPSGGPTSAMSSVPTQPAKNDASAATASAGPARPCRAIW